MRTKKTVKTHDYLICYDIADPKRLSKVAKFLEKEAFRVQYSIFLLKNCNKDRLYSIAQKIIELFDPNEDDVRIYKIKDYGIHLGRAYDLREVFLIV
jgi:CRISPR-associated protein Cas2